MVRVRPLRHGHDTGTLARMSPTPRRIVVVGAGYVGLVTAVGLATKGHRVEVVETNPDRLSILREGRSPIHEAGLPEALSAMLATAG